MSHVSRVAAERSIPPPFVSVGSNGRKSPMATKSVGRSNHGFENVFMTSSLMDTPQRSTRSHSLDDFTATVRSIAELTSSQPAKNDAAFFDQLRCGIRDYDEAKRTADQAGDVADEREEREWDEGLTATLHTYKSSAFSGPGDLRRRSQDHDRLQSLLSDMFLSAARRKSASGGALEPHTPQDLLETMSPHDVADLEQYVAVWAARMRSIDAVAKHTRKRIEERHALEMARLGRKAMDRNIALPAALRNSSMASLTTAERRAAAAGDYHTAAELRDMRKMLHTTGVLPLTAFDNARPSRTRSRQLANEEVHLAAEHHDELHEFDLHVERVRKWAEHARDRGFARCVLYAEERWRTRPDSRTRLRQTGATVISYGTREQSPMRTMPSPTGRSRSGVFEWKAPRRRSADAADTLILPGILRPAWRPPSNATRK